LRVSVSRQCGMRDRRIVTGSLEEAHKRGEFRSVRRQGNRVLKIGRGGGAQIIPLAGSNTVC